MWSSTLRREARSMYCDRQIGHVCAASKIFARTLLSKTSSSPTGVLFFSPFIWPASDPTSCKKKAAPME